MQVYCIGFCWHKENDLLGWPILPKYFCFYSEFSDFLYPKGLIKNEKFRINIEIYYPTKPIKVLYYELLRGKNVTWILLQKSMMELNYWPQWIILCLLGPPRLPKKIWGLWANILYVAQGAQIPQNTPKWAPGSHRGGWPTDPKIF